MNARDRIVFDTLTGTGHTGKERGTAQGHFFTVLLFAVFVISLLLCIVAGTEVYGNLRQMQVAAGNTRLGVNLISNTIHANDAVNAVAVGQGPEGRALVLVEDLESGVYETRIYLYQGQIVEEYSLQGSAYTPARATAIVASRSFDFSYTGGLLSVTCDEGTAEVAIRSLKGGA